MFCHVDVIKFGADACRCVPMRAGEVDAVISHTLTSMTEVSRQSISQSQCERATKAIDIQKLNYS